MPHRNNQPRREQIERHRLERRLKRAEPDQYEVMSATAHHVDQRNNADGQVGEKDNPLDWPTSIAIGDTSFTLTVEDEADLVAVGAIMYVVDSASGDTSSFDFRFQRQPSGWSLARMEWDIAHAGVDYSPALWSTSVNSGVLGIEIVIASPLDAYLHYSMVTTR